MISKKKINKILIVIFVLLILFVIIYMTKIKSKTKKWNDILKEWSEGNYLKYPNKIKMAFLYETTPIKNGNEIYKEKFIENNYLDKMKEDYSSFYEHIKKSKNKYVISFNNLSNDTLLIIPTPKKNKKFTTIKDFMDNSSETQQKYFWKYVSKTIKNLIKDGKTKYWISTHGSGVPYFHLRISLKPKYYVTKSFMK